MRLEQVAQRGCGVSMLRDIKSLTRHCPAQPALADPTLSRSVCGESGLDGLQRDLPTSTIL